MGRPGGKAGDQGSGRDARGVQEKQMEKQMRRKFKAVYDCMLCGTEFEKKAEWDETELE